MKIYYDNGTVIETDKCKCGNMVIVPQDKCIICKNKEVKK